MAASLFFAAGPTWQWYQHGFVFRCGASEILLGSDVMVFVNRPVSAGKGRHKGVEDSAASFFTFLSGISKSFGGSANFTYNGTPDFRQDGQVALTYEPRVFVSKYVYIFVGLFERASLNVRIACNWRSRREVSRDAFNTHNKSFMNPADWLETSISYDMNKNFTVALEAANLTRAGEQWYLYTKSLPRDIAYFARIYSLSASVRF